jgi:hypothetical protein
MVLVFAVLEQTTSSTPFSTPSSMNNTSAPAESALPKTSCAPSSWIRYPRVSAERGAGQRYRSVKTSAHLPSLC